MTRPAPMSCWQLDDATAIAEANRYTFYQPSLEIISKVGVGEVVKLIFRGEGHEPESVFVERMWVLVDAIEPDGHFVGRLDNDPRGIANLKAGDPVRFEARHIINTEHDNPDNLVGRYSKRAFVTQRILADGVPIGRLYREAPDEEQDSGWRFTAGDETDDYMDDADNSRYVSLGAILAKDDSVIHLLEAPEGARFFRDPDTGLFEPV